MNRLFLVVSAALALAITACKPATDLNQPCRLVRRNPDGGQALALKESQVRDAQGQNKDFIAVGSIDCEDLICVRDSFYASDAGADADAFGYCSRQCVEGSQCPSFDEKFDKGSTALRCRALLLDKETLAALAGDGGFTGVRDPFFCARGASADGGM